VWTRPAERRRRFSAPVCWIASSLASGGGVSGGNFWPSQSSSGRSASASASNSSSKPPSTKPMVLSMPMLGSASGNTNTSGGGSTSTSAPPPQPHIGDKDKLVDASALDTFNVADTLAGEMSSTPSTSSDLDQGGGDVRLAEMSMSPSVSGVSNLYAVSEQTGLTSWHASEGCRSEAGTSTILRTHSAGHSRKKSTSENYGHLGLGSNLRRFLFLST